ncbi:MAG: Fic family protein [Candidatus Aenigmatarchaeota archaeon]
MVYVEKVELKGREYYRLVHTLRKGEKIVHKRRYVGVNLPNPARLERLKKEFLNEILAEKSKYLTKFDLERIENKKKKYQKELKRLSKSEKEKRIKEFIIRFTYDSSKLAGVIITLRQTSLILKDGIIPKNIKSLKTVKELENHEKGILAITRYKGPLNIGFIKKLHKILLSGIDDSIAGKIRDELKRDVKIAGTSYTPPKWHEIKKELNYFFKWYKVENRKLHPLELASLIHLKIISIQPFVDGNSRLSRLLMNWVLWKKKYPLIDIPIEDLEDYYDVLDIYQIEKKEEPFINYIKKKYFSGY